MVTRYIPQEVSGQGIKAVHQRPWCANEDSIVIARFDAATAWETYPKLELQPPHAFASIILDVDTPSEGGLAWRQAVSSTIMDGGQRAPRDTREPSWGHSLCLCFGSTHRTPQRGSHAALSYLAYVADRLSYHLGADPGYTGLITRNPINPGPDCFTHWGRLFPYTLSELDHLLPKGKPPSRRQTAIGRNCDLFMSMVSEVFRPRWAAPLSAQGWTKAWLEHVRAQNIALFETNVLPDSECRSIAKSCFRYWMRHYDPDMFSDIQRARNGKRWHGDFAYDFDHQAADVRELKGWGLKQVTIGAVVGLSQGRVSKILSQGLNCYGRNISQGL